MCSSNKVFIIAGPTASGKTNFAVDMAHFIDGEIINCDMAQCYHGIPIGTAQPSLCEQGGIKHHFFGYLTDPVFQNAFSHKTLIEEKCREILGRKKVPIIVGGSYFYLYSLFFTYEYKKTKSTLPNEKFKHPCKEITSECWNCLNDYDPAAASCIHKNDIYRLSRAFQLIEEDVIPSERKPFFNPQFNFHTLYISTNREELCKKILNRTEKMLREGWIEEVESLDEEWKNFIDRKKIIGYSAIISEINNNKIMKKTHFNNNDENFKKLVETISQETRQYAKRQVCFFKRMKKHVSEYNALWTDCTNAFNDLEKKLL